MGDLSRHYSHRDFICRCEECAGKKRVRVHMGLVGVLEELCAMYRRRVRVESGYRCRALAEKMGSPAKGVHSLGRAVHISLDGVTLPDLYHAVAVHPEIKGIGYYPEDKVIHIDTREEFEREEWVKELGKVSALTPDKRAKYGLPAIETIEAELETARAKAYIPRRVPDSLEPLLEGMGRRLNEAERMTATRSPSHHSHKH